MTYVIEEEFYRAIYHAATIGEAYILANQFEFEYVFTDEDILRIKEIFSNFHKYHVNDNIVGEGRIQSSILFFKVATETFRNETRLVNFSIALESIFSTDNIELSYKSVARKKIFEEVQEIYNLRSRIGHGNVLKKKEKNKIPKTLENLETYLRASIIKILKEPKLISIFKDDTEINNYFDDLILE